MSHWEYLSRSVAVLFLSLAMMSLDAHAQSTVAEKPAEAKAAEAKPAPPVDLGALFRMHWTNRTNAFRMQNEQLQFVVLLGDSITEGFEVAKYLPGRRVLNRGIGADVIGNDLPADDNRGVLKRLDESVFNCAATDVFLMIGINDLGSGRTPDVMEQGYRDILQRIKTETPRVRVHVQSVLPTRDNEMFGMAAIEAQACGRPVVCSNHGGLPEVVDPSQVIEVIDHRLPELPDRRLAIKWFLEHFSAHPHPRRSLSKFRLAGNKPCTTSTIQNVPLYFRFE